MHHRHMSKMVLQDGHQIHIGRSESYRQSKRRLLPRGWPKSGKVEKGRRPLQPTALPCVAALSIGGASTEIWLQRHSGRKGAVRLPIPNLALCSRPHDRCGDRTLQARRWVAHNHPPAAALWCLDADSLQSEETHHENISVDSRLEPCRGFHCARIRGCRNTKDGSRL